MQKLENKCNGSLILARVTVKTTDLKSVQKHQMIKVQEKRGSLMNLFTRHALITL